VDISTPPVVTGAGVSFVDLVLDVVRADDGTVAILDEDEEAVKRSMPSEVIVHARRACDEVADLMSASEPPFDGTAERWLRRFLRLTKM
jgi:hypothetical protein